MKLVSGGSGSWKFADDEKIGDWAKDAVYRMKAAAGLLEGRDGNAFDPRARPFAVKSQRYSTVF